jgi:acetyl esterase/lipase
MLISRRGIGSGTAALAALSVLGPAQAATARKIAYPALDPATLIHPELQEMVKMFTERMPARAPFTAESLVAARSFSQNFVPKPLASPAIEEKTIPGRGGAPDVRVLVIGAKPEIKNRPAVVFIHGGGYILGSAMGEIISAQSLAAELDCLVISVDYQLAPETRFPGSLEDNYAALSWVYGNAVSLGVDRRRIAVVGGSAGGGHAATLAIAARDRGEIPICYQVLIYPMLDDRTGSTRMPPPFIGTFNWKAGDNKFGWTSLLGVPAGSPSVPKGAVPARVEDLSGLPPAFIGVGTLDLFVEEDMAYAQRLVLAGVPTKMLVVPGAIHGFDQMAAQTRIAKEFTSAWRAELAARFTALQ